MKDGPGEAKEMKKKALLCNTAPLQFPPWQGGKEGLCSTSAKQESTNYELAVR
jgi:hypothetical protein